MQSWQTIVSSLAVGLLPVLLLMLRQWSKDNSNRIASRAKAEADRVKAETDAMTLQAKARADAMTLEAKASADAKMLEAQTDAAVAKIAAESAAESEREDSAVTQKTMAHYEAIFKSMQARLDSLEKRNDACEMRIEAMQEVLDILDVDGTAHTQVRLRIAKKQAAREHDDAKTLPIRPRNG